MLYNKPPQPHVCHWRRDTPMAIGHNRDMYRPHPRGIHVALFLTYNLKFSYDFKMSKPKRSKRLPICPPLPIAIPTGNASARDFAKLWNLSEISYTRRQKRESVCPIRYFWMLRLHCLAMKGSICLVRNKIIPKFADGIGQASRLLRMVFELNSNGIWNVF